MASGVLEGSEISAAMGNVHLFNLIIFSLFNSSTFLTSMGVLYFYYGGNSCPDNVSIITVSLVLMLAVAVIQLSGSNGSIVTTSVLALYVAYLTYVAVSLNPSASCNANLASTGNNFIYGLGPSILGIICSFLSILWISQITSRRIAGISKPTKSIYSLNYN